MRDSEGRWIYPERDWSNFRSFWNRRHCVYRMYAADGQLLYVGVSSDILERMRSHNRLTRWWDDTARISVKIYPTREAALAAEVQAIHDELPLHNRRSSRRHLVA